MPLRCKDFGDGFQNETSFLGGYGLHSKIETECTWVFSYLGDGRGVVRSSFLGYL